MLCAFLNDIGLCWSDWSFHDTLIYTCFSSSLVNFHLASFIFEITQAGNKWKISETFFLCCKKGKNSLTWDLPEGTKTNPLLWWESFTIAIIHNISRKPLSLFWIYQTDCKHVFERNSHDETLSMRLIWRKRQIATELMPKAELQRFVIVIRCNLPQNKYAIMSAKWKVNTNSIQAPATFRTFRPFQRLENICFQVRSHSVLLFTATHCTLKPALIEHAKSTYVTYVRVKP